MMLLELIILFSLACIYPTGRHMMDWDHMSFGFGGVFMWLILLVIIGLIIYFIINGQNLVKHEARETPLEILKKRYAKGEISKEEYDRIKKDLGE